MTKLASFSRNSSSRSFSSSNSGGKEKQLAKKSAVNRNTRVKQLVKQFAAKRAALKATANDAKLAPEERFDARLKLAELPRNSSKTRIRNRCEVTGRPRGYYRKLRMSRISLRDLGSAGLIPGLVKSSW